jgi:hypothetical protein
MACAFLQFIFLLLLQSRQEKWRGFPLPSGLKSKSFLHQNFTKLLHQKFKNKITGILENL